MNIVSFSEELLIPVAKLCRQNMPLDRIPDFLLREKTFGDSDYNPEITLVAYDENSSEPIAFIQGLIRIRKDGTVGYIKLLCVDSNYRRKGIARELYQRLEDFFIANNVPLVRVYESYPNYFMPGIDPFYTEAVCFFERMKFKKFNDTSNLAADLTSQTFDVEAELNRLIKEGIECYRPSFDEKEEILGWVAEEFYGWIPEVTASFKDDEVSLFIARINGKIAAFSAYEVNNIGTGWFGPMGTDSKLRGKGVGGVLLLQCLRAMKEVGFVKAIIPWVGAIPFYMHYVNSRVERVFWRYEKKLE